MSEMICVTNRALCRDGFLERIEAIAACNPAGIILREKNLPKEEYCALAKKVMKICDRYKVLCILHKDVETAIQLKAQALHVPLPVLRQMAALEKDAGQDGLQSYRQAFRILGASCHSVEEAAEAEKLGCTYIVAGHIFATDCKKGVPPRGLSFLQEVCRSVHIPVYAIGGINSENIVQVRAAGAKGGCVMSGLMTCENPAQYMQHYCSACKEK